MQRHITPAAQVSFDIPATTVKRWNALPATEPIALSLTRQDIDNLFFAIDENLRAVAALQKALIDYTNGQLDDANGASTEASTRLGVGSNRLRMFMNAVMAGAEIDK